MVRFLLLWSLALVFLTSCEKSAGPASTAGSQTQSTNERSFQVKGIVKAIHPNRKEIEIKHQDIPGYMPGMTMPFDVKDTNELAGLVPGQPISFRLTVTDTEGWVDRIKPTGPAPAAVFTKAASEPPTHVVQPLQIGESVPVYHLTNQFGKAISTTQFKGQALAITFLFTRCPFPTFCPRLANDFAQTQQKLLSLPSGPTNWQLLTVSIDPEFDQPDVLKAYAEGHNYDPAHWTFATGELGDIIAFGNLFGLAFWRDSTGSITHNIRTAVINTEGRVQKVFEGNNWNVADLVAEIVKAAKS